MSDQRYTKGRSKSVASKKQTFSDLPGTKMEHYEVARSFGGRSFSTDKFREKYLEDGHYPKRNEGSIMPRDYCWNNTYTYEKWKKFDHFLGKVAPDEYIFVGDDDEPLVREFLNRTNDMPRETKSDREARQEVGYEVFSRAKEDGSVTGKNPPAIAMEESLKPSPSIQPAYGERTSNYEDGATYVYLMLFPGGPEVLLGKSRDHVGQALVKVGRSDDPERRLGEVNFGFPKPQAQGWELNKKHRFLDGDTATDIEKIIKKEFDKEFTSQGGEFFTGDLDAMQSHFDDLCKSRMPENLGAPGKARGI